MNLIYKRLIIILEIMIFFIIKYIFNKQLMKFNFKEFTESLNVFLKSLSMFFVYNNLSIIFLMIIFYHWFYVHILVKRLYLINNYF